MAETLIVSSFAKVNMALNVLEKRPGDGYHYVDMIMLPVRLADTVTLSPAGTLAVSCTPDVAGPMESNLAYRAAALLRQVTGVAGGADIHIEKVIPVAGGLAGGSTNAAAVLKGLNRLWNTGLTDDQLVELAIRLGSDVPFFIAQQPARVQGIGERLIPVTVRQPLCLVLATPPVAKSTGNVYRLFDELERVDRPDVAAMQQALAEGHLRGVAECLGNVFEQVMLPRHPEIAAVKEAMLGHGAVGALMSGAGPTVFGLVADEEAGRYLAGRLQARGLRTFLTRSVGHEGEG
ncbi:MAG TPA: 4-(cytidine 5'-diphospho)-2-C-methyl-D-erythritol kinase [Symbiobacteriaceae bacterium]|nr:4-(cytidine 5'-diphospho)-2-C-methyl-D-erythritol kinase [Symbiobacteriaceae bacterium]